MGAFWILLYSKVCQLRILSISVTLLNEIIIIKQSGKSGTIPEFLLSDY